MRSPFRTTVGAGVLLMVSLGVGGDARQEPSPPASQQPGERQAAPDEPQQPVFRAGVNFVRIDVIVSDKDGNLVADLKPGDFEVTEDGKPQTIETFKLVQLDGGAAQSADGPPKPIRDDYDEEAEAARDDVRLFAIFLDDYHVRRGTSMRIRDPLSTFVQTQLGPSDMVGLMYPLESTASLRMTRNHTAVIRGIQQFAGRKFDYKPTNQYEARYSYYPAETVERIRNEVSLSAIKALSVHMGSLKEGRKALILVSEGYTNVLPPQLRDPIADFSGGGNPQRDDPMAGVGDPNEARAAAFASLDLESELREVYDTANRNNVAIYTIDPRGLTGFEFDIDEGVNSRTDRVYLSSATNTLRTLAEQTDGRAIVNRNDLQIGMKQIVRDSAGYYLIGYDSTSAPSDGKFHRVKVRVKRPGLQVRSRRGYWALNPLETARATSPKRPGPGAAVEVALAAISQPARGRVIRTWIGTSLGEHGKTRVTFIWEPLPQVRGDRRLADDRPARVSLMAVGADGEPYFRGRIPDVALASAAVASNQTPGANGGAASRLPSRVTFEAQPGKMQLRVSVEGASLQILDSEVREITVPDLTSPQTTLATPKVFRARTAREYQQLKSDPDAVPVAAREFSRTERLIIRVPAYGPAHTVPTLTARLLNRAGQAMSDLPVMASAAPNGEAQFEVPLAGLAPGEYLVEIKATGESGDAKELVGFRMIG